jgi:hypothetical protein
MYGGEAARSTWMCCWSCNKASFVEFCHDASVQHFFDLIPRRTVIKSHYIRGDKLHATFFILKRASVSPDENSVEFHHFFIQASALLVLLFYPAYTGAAERTPRFLAKPRSNRGIISATPYSFSLQCFRTVRRDRRLWITSINSQFWIISFIWYTKYFCRFRNRRKQNCIPDLRHVPPVCLQVKIENWWKDIH